MSLEGETLLGPGVHVDGVAVLGGLRVLLPDLDALVGFARQETATYNKTEG